MTIVAGTQLGPYAILSPIGAGGMGEVYRARDAKLNRDVALKVLPEAFARDAERMSRFEREAQVLASLNHPNIAIIHGLEESGGTRALVMELVEGPTLADRVAQGPMPADEALPIARQIAEALEAAHDHGIVHRDLKPANVKVTPEGKVKLLDFGLAKALDPSASTPNAANSPTLALAATQPGIILGTVAYMSPEQAKGKAADRRADIWSFGAVLYEMLAGKPVYSGETVSETLAHVITRDPGWEALPASLSPRMTRLLRRCLTKDPGQRLQAIGEARISLEAEIAGRGDDGAAAEMAQGARSRRSWIFLAAAAVVSAAAALLAVLPLKPAPVNPALRKLSIAAPGLRPEIATPPVISPDGRKLVFVTDQGLWIRELDQLSPRELVKGDTRFPFWSPDSNYVAYLAQAKLWRVPISGGEPTAIAAVRFRLGAQTPGGVWTRDGRILFAAAATGSGGFFAVPAQGGDFSSFVEQEAKTESDFHKPSLLPGDKGVLFVVDQLDGGADTIAVLTGRTRKVVLRLKGEALDCPVYSGSGHILYERDSGNPGIWAIPFSLEKLEATGEPFLVAQGASWPSVSIDGTLLYSPLGNEERQVQMVWLDRNGNVQGPVGTTDHFLGDPRISPDGGKVAATGGSSRERQVFVTDLKRQTKIRLTFEDGFSYEPAWSGSGGLVYYSRKRHGVDPEIMVRASDGSGSLRLVAPAAFQPGVSRDGKLLVFTRITPGTGVDLWYAPVEGEGKKDVPLLVAPGNQRAPELSPDDRFVAYSSDESGRDEIYLRPFPAGEGKWQVSSGGGASPHWNRKGDRLYYRQDNALMEVEVSSRPALTLGAARELFRTDANRVLLGRNYDVSPDGTRFLAVQLLAQENTKILTLNLVENWFAEFASKR